MKQIRASVKQTEMDRRTAEKKFSGEAAASLSGKIGGKKKALSRFFSSEGFTLAETLMTILIMTMVTAAIAGGVVVARNTYRRISRRADAQTLLATTISALSADFSGATKFEDSGTDSESSEVVYAAPFYTTSRTYSIRYINAGPGDGSSNSTTSRKGIYVVPIVSSDSSDDASSENLAAAVPLVTTKTQTLDLYTQITAEKPESTAVTAGNAGTFKYDKDNKTVTFWVAVYSTMSGISNPVEKAVVCIHTAE